MELIDAISGFFSQHDHSSDLIGDFDSYLSIHGMDISDFSVADTENLADLLSDSETGPQMAQVLFGSTNTVNFGGSLESFLHILIAKLNSGS